MQSAVYWLLAAVTVVAGEAAPAPCSPRASFSRACANHAAAGLLREVASRAWRRVFHPAPLHLEQERQQQLKQQRQPRREAESVVGAAVFEMQPQP